jgi:ketosteroid isomerase-like protein
MSARETLAAYEDRINRHDFDLLVDLIAPDATFWFSDGTHRGIDEIRAAFEATWRALADETYWLDQLEWIADGDNAAACTYRFNWKTAGASGSGRGTTVLRRGGERWLLVHQHQRATPP